MELSEVIYSTRTCYQRTRLHCKTTLFKEVCSTKILITIELTLLLIFIIKFAFNFLSLPNKSQISCDEFISMGQSVIGEPMGQQKNSSLRIKKTRRSSADMCNYCNICSPRLIEINLIASLK